MRSFGHRILSGLRASLPLAIFWGLFAALVYSCGDDPHPERHESLRNLLILYFSVAIVCGAAYGLLKDWANTNIRFGVMCSVIGLLWSVALMLMVHDWDITKVDQFTVFVLGFFGAALGPPIGFYWRSRDDPKQSRSNKELQPPPILERVDDSYGRERVSPEVAPLLHEVYAQVVRTDTDVRGIHRALNDLLTFLTSPAGRTHANCVATDSFFMHNDRWERDWEHLPEPYQDLLSLLGDALHDTVSAPEIAENFHNTPEQLLSQLSQIK